MPCANILAMNRNKVIRIKLVTISEKSCSVVSQMRVQIWHKITIDEELMNNFVNNIFQIIKMIKKI